MPTITPVPGSNVRYWWVFLVRGIIFLVVGFLTLRYPLESYLTLSILFGATMFITGLMEMVYTLSNRKTRAWGLRLFAAIIDLALGVILIVNIGITIAVLPFVIGFWFLFRGISMLSFSAVVGDTGSMIWLTAGGILLMFLALLILINPDFGVLTLITWTVIAFIAGGIFSIIQAFQLKGARKKSHRADREYVVHG